MITFADYTTQWRETVLPLMKPASQVSMRSHLTRLNAAFGALSLDLSYPVVQGFFTAQAQIQAPKTIRNLWGTFHLILAAAKREGLIAKVPQIALPKAVRREQEWLSVTDMRQIIAMATPKTQPFYALLAETGLRISEAVGLQVNDFDPDKQTLTIRRSVHRGRPQTPKTSAAYRTLTLSTTLTGLLNEVVENKEAGSFMFPSRSRSGTQICTQKLANCNLHVLMRKLRLEPVGWHAFRRGNATLLCSVLGCPEKIAAYRLGHRAPGLTLGLYAQNWVGIDKAWAPKIEKVLFGVKEEDL
jgi:integrase